jgi:FKBP-type peptidyl-prolyl cis-trans isomerase
MNLFSATGVLTAGLLFSGMISAADLDSNQQQLGYIIGVDIGSSLKEQGTQVDLEAVFAGIRDAYEGRGLAISNETATQVREAFIAERTAAVEAQRLDIAEGNLRAGETFLANNARQADVTVTGSGLQYKVVTMGRGQRPVATDSVKVHYRGTLLDGSEFDSTYERDEPLVFKLDRVIPGWSEGLQLMPVGSKFILYVPPSLAYGEGEAGPIPPNSTLTFEVELLAIELPETDG